jgi:hypothetical protein
MSFTAYLRATDSLRLLPEPGRFDQDMQFAPDSLSLMTTNPLCPP